MTASTRPHAPAAPGSTSDPRSDLLRRPLARDPGRDVQLALGAGTTAFGLALWTGLVANPMASTEAIGGLAGALSATLLGVLMTALGAVGLLLASRRVSTTRPLSLGLTGAQLVGYVLVASTAHLIMLLGYLLAAAVPLGAVALAVLACRRYPVARVLVVLAAIAVAVWGGTTGVLTVANVGGTFGKVASALAAQATEQLVLLWSGAGVVVGALGVLHLLADSPVRPGWEGWLLRHQRALTLVAAAGPLPYFCIRLTWLTPWPQGAPFDLDPSIRLWGLLLGSAGLIGSLLTLGLIRPWGTTLPRWVPGAAGRPVPVLAAAGPAATVAVALVVAAVPMTVSVLSEFGLGSTAEVVLYLVAFPFAVWGPALALATWAYVVRRRSAPSGRPELAG